MRDLGRQPAPVLRWAAPGGWRRAAGQAPALTGSHAPPPPPPCPPAMRCTATALLQPHPARARQSGRRAWLPTRWPRCLHTTGLCAAWRPPTAASSPAAAPPPLRASRSGRRTAFYWGPRTRASRVRARLLREVRASRAQPGGAGLPPRALPILVSNGSDLTNALQSLSPVCAGVGLANDMAIVSPVTMVQENQRVLVSVGPSYQQCRWPRGLGRRRSSVPAGSLRRCAC